MIKNGVAIPLNRTLKELNGDPVVDEADKPITFKRYLRMAFSRSRGEPDVISMLSLGMKLADCKEDTFPLEDANLEMVKRIVESDSILMATGQMVKIPDYMRAQVLQVLKGK